MSFFPQFFCFNFWVVAKTRGRGRNVFSFPNFLFQFLLFNSPVLLLSNDRHLSFIYGAKRIKKNKEPAEAMKALKEHMPETLKTR